MEAFNGNRQSEIDGFDKGHRRVLVKTLLCMLLVSSTAALADALTLVWDGGASGNFSTGPWSGGEAGHETPQDGDVLIMNRLNWFIYTMRHTHPSILRNPAPYPQNDNSDHFHPTYPTTFHTEYHYIIPIKQ